MTVPSGAALAATPASLLDAIVTLHSQLSLGMWPWAMLAAALVSYAAYRTVSALTPDTVEDLGARHARQLTEGGQR